MNSIDIVLAILLLIGFYSGWKKGLFVALTSLLGLIAGVIGAIYFSDYVAAYLVDSFRWSEQVINLAAFAITFLGIVIIISMLGKILTKIADFAMLGIVNKILGGVFGLLKAAFFVSVIFMFLNASESLSGYLISEEKKESSVLYPHVASVAPLVLPQILSEVENFRNENTTTPEKVETTPETLNE